MSDQYGAGNAGMPSYLFIASIANALFLTRSLRDVFSSSGTLPKQPALALLAASVSELIWVLPCMVQCSMVFFGGKAGDWSPSSRTGCDIMGFYSQYGSLCSMLVTVLTAWLSYRISHKLPLPSVPHTAACFASIFVAALVVSVLPLVGAVEPYASSGAGFCYIDWFDAPQAVLMLMFSVGAIAATLGLFGAAARGTWDNKLDLLLLAAGFLSAWILWPPAAIVGLAHGDDGDMVDSFPQHYMILGGILGHAQALINPYLYGMRWRCAMLRLHSDGARSNTSVKKTMPTESS